ncbi:MAG: bifunctional alpha,alpha-trehalose-phosphate synthase (UDP-forming)/trehalose-phosphatase [Deltaproteobacteria bacterium]|nr:MAG: bifunctional alpha,alpha-trehalose-phosphate synthase (UDP-forming)/trehalose-phosphatase [Deltaproteobacteria bacterium]
MSRAGEQGRTLIVSNRLPVQAKVVGGRPRLQRSSGGLVTGLEGVHGPGRSLWIGCLGLATTKSLGLSDDDRRFLDEHGLVVVEVPQELYDGYYEGFSNSAIWPLFHYNPDRCHFSATMWEAYREVNQKFAETIAARAEPGDRVWVHDYQLMLVPDLLRRLRRDLTIGFFLHIPFPSAELFRILPWRGEILTGLLGADLVGFHTLEYMRHFSNAVARVAGLEPQMDTLSYGRRQVRLGAFPLGVNVRDLHEVARSPEAEAHLAQLRESYRDRTVLLGVDRLDYTKGIPERLMAFGSFLERHPRWVGKVTLVQVSVPSRVNVGEYRQLKEEVDGLVGRINGRFGTAGYVPVHYIFRNLDKPYLMALYRRADIALVTPIRDGLNLVCKEFVAAKGDEPGVLILSEFAGAAAEMGEAVLVNPWNRDNVISAIEAALEMPIETRSSMMASLSERLSRYDNRAWSTNFLDALDEAAEVNRRSGYAATMEPDADELCRRAREARNVFLFIDYDGTLVPIVDKPELAVPPEAVCDLIREMAAVPNFRAAIVSGRDRAFLERYLPKEIALVAEHGACIRRAGEDECVHLVDQAAYQELRENVLGVMLDFERRIPGSKIEEKEFGIVWHYRMADPIFAQQQALVLADTLGGLLQHTPLGVLISKKAVEVRHVGVNKGEGVRALLEEEGFDPSQDLLITAGDDRTDEDMFRVYPAVNVSISVSDTPLAASYVMERESFVALLEEITRQGLRQENPLSGDRAGRRSG